MLATSNSSNFTTNHDSNKSQKNHKYLNPPSKTNSNSSGSGPTITKKNFINAYRSKENKVNSLEMIKDIESPY